MSEDEVKHPVESVPGCAAARRPATRARHCTPGIQGGSPRQSM